MQQIVFCTCPDQQTAQALANRLITERLAACVNIFPGVTSIYPWQGEVETAQEYLLLIKTRQEYFNSLAVLIKSLHPYQLPEIVAVNIERGTTEYLQWIDSCLCHD